MPLDKIRPIGKIRYQQSRLRDGRNTDAVIFIPEELLQRKKANGLTLYLNVFWLSKDLLNFRRLTQHKVAVFSVSQHVRIGDKDYNAPYVKLEIIVPSRELPRITDLLMKGDSEMCHVAQKRLRV